MHISDFGRPIAHFRFHEKYAAQASRFQKDAHGSLKVYQISDFGKVHATDFRLSAAFRNLDAFFRFQKSENQISVFAEKIEIFFFWLDYIHQILDFDRFGKGRFQIEIRFHHD